MGFGIKELLIILVIVILLFGTKKLKNMSSDLGGAVKGFRKSMNDDDEKPEAIEEDPSSAETIINEAEQGEKQDSDNK